MAPLLIDEDLPRSLAAGLRKEGLAAEDVRDLGLRGQDDASVFSYAQSRGLVLVSGDLGFANILRYPLGSHSGIVIARFPNEMPAAQVTQSVVAGLRYLSEEDMRGNLVVISPGRIRLRRLR
jgi:predicted nuclease of predicted toxin-antitoxin system